LISWAQLLVFSTQSANDTGQNRRPWNWRIGTFWTLLIIGAIVRFWALGVVPAGLNPDEASSGVEALSILQTGMDRWGNRLPVWFPAWGSGMNPLFSYLALPFVAGFGLNVTVIRAVGAFFGVLTLPVAYRTAKLYFGPDAAIVTLALIALLPWHVMSSRWALDSNLAPLCFTLGLLTIGLALRDGGGWPLLAFVPWAVSAYAYPVSIVATVASGPIILILFRREIRRRLGVWIAGLGLAALVALPFLLFLIKNQFDIGHLPGEDLLPFSLPTMPATRLSQIRMSLVETVWGNLTFLVGGFHTTGAPWEQSAAFLPLTAAAPVLIAGGFVALLRAYRKSELATGRLAAVILIVIGSAIVPLCVIPLNLTRFNWCLTPSIMVAAWFAIEIGKRYRWGAGAMAAYLAIFLVLFYPYYFRRYNDELPILDMTLGNGFRIGLEDALRTEVALAEPTEPILVDIGAVHPYLYVLFFGLGDIESFQHTRAVRIEKGVYRVSSFGRFFFEKNALPSDRSFVFVSLAKNPPCADADVKSSGAIWAVGRCPAR
jgi:4-amino-4-deoxy-L-arabinose transferase-like glycosyltransferase